MTESKTHGRTKTGVKLTDDVLDELAEQAEAGLDVSKLRRRPGRPLMGLDLPIRYPSGSTPSCDLA